jgi:histidinol-phosphate/aromatic aminotransferase/cobyric acid decarboxylase-like protein
VDAVKAEGFLLRSLSVHHATRSYVRLTVGTPNQNARCLAAVERVAKRIVKPNISTTYGVWAAAGDAE